MKIARIVADYRDYVTRRAWAAGKYGAYLEVQNLSAPWVLSVLAVMLIESQLGLSRSVLKIVGIVSLAILLCGQAFVLVIYLRVASARRRGQEPPFPVFDDDRIY